MLEEKLIEIGLKIPTSVLLSHCPNPKEWDVGHILKYCLRSYKRLGINSIYKIKFVQ